VAGEPSGLLQALGDDDPPTSAKATPPLARLGVAAAELTPFVESMLPMVQHERALCAMPFALTVR
jgi:hypothetical protein